MADLVTRIIADDKQFNDKIEKGKKTVKGFSDEANKAGNSAGGFDKKLTSLAGGALTKLIGGFGVAATAGAAFKKIIDNSQTSADEFQAVLGGAKTTVDQFFKSISTGDFTNFVNGLGDVYKRAKHAQIALDQLWNTQTSFNLLNSEAQFKLTSARADANDRELSPDVRRQALGDWKDAIEDMRGYSETYRKDILETTKSIVQTYNTLGSESFGFDDLMETFKLDLIDPSRRDEIKQAVFDDYNAYTEAVKQARKDAEYTYRKATTVGGHTTYNKSKGFKQGQFDSELKTLNDQYKSAILAQSLLEAATDEQLKDIADRLKEYSAVGQQIGTLDLTYNRMKTRLESQIETDEKGLGSGKGVKIDIIPDGSIAELDKKLQDARKAFANATTEEARAAADKLIQEISAKKAIVEIQFKYTDPGNIDSGNIDPVKTVTKLDALQGIDKLRGRRSGMVERLRVELDPASISKLNSDIKGIDDSISTLQKNFNLEINLPETGAGNFEKLTDGSLEAAEGINDIADAMYNMSAAVDSGAGAWLRWGANTLQAIGQAIPAIMALTTAKNAEATANTASAATGAASSVASIPYAGPILAVAAIATVIAALASLPKFAYGGIVPGGSFSGDNMLARVNSGEMILNKGQQSNLFNIINGGGSAGGTRKIELTMSGKTARALIDVDQLWRSRI